jgi:hypothetical protein
LDEYLQLALKTARPLLFLEAWRSFRVREISQRQTKKRRRRTWSRMMTVRRRSTRAVGSLRIIVVCRSCGRRFRAPEPARHQRAHITTGARTEILYATIKRGGGLVRILRAAETKANNEPCVVKNYAATKECMDTIDVCRRT